MGKEYTMYEGMLGALGELKDDSMRVAKIGASVFVGAALAKVVVGLSDKYISTDDKTSMTYKYLNPLFPALAGVVIVNRLGNQYPEYSLGAAAGMFAYTLGALLQRNVGVDAKEADDRIGPRLSPFSQEKAYGALGAPDNYDSSLLAGLGQARYGGPSIPNYSVSRYMMAGAPTQIQSLMGAPTQIQSLMGAPTQIQSLMGAPTQIQSLNGAPTQVQTVSPAAAGAAATLV